MINNYIISYHLQAPIKCVHLLPNIIWLKTIFHQYHPKEIFKKFYKFMASFWKISQP